MILSAKILNDLEHSTTNTIFAIKERLMPKIFEYFGFIFLFYSNEHEPIHVHVNKEGHEVIFEILMEGGKLTELRRRTSNKMPPLSEKDSATAEAFVRKYYRNIVEKWVNFFIYKKKVRSTKITKKL